MSCVPSTSQGVCHLCAQDGIDPFPKGEETLLAYSSADYMDAWREMELAYDEGLVRAVGLANFNSKQIERLERDASVEPMMLQVISICLNIFAIMDAP